MRPVVWLDVVLTPRRWSLGFARTAAGFEAMLTRDTSGLARRLNAALAPLSRLRAAVLTGRPLLMRLAWAFRKTVWSFIWTVIAVMRLWPRRPRVPEPDVPIALVPAPKTYPDFHSPTLVVPSDMPRAEMTLPGAITVQMLHVLQDVYPVISTHQPPAAAEPDERLRQAYSWLYRLLRSPPRWHPDLSEARRRGNLLGALAVGGPFAKMLQRDARPGQHIIDLDYLRGYPVRSGLTRLGCRIFFTEEQGQLRTTGIEHKNQVVEPGQRDWAFAERVALCSLLTHTTVWRHGMQFHVGGVAPFAVVTYQLPPEHPVRRLLVPHLADMLSTNFHTHLTLRRSGFDVTGFSFSYDTILRYYDDGAQYFDISRLDPRDDLAARGIGESLHYPHHPQALMYLAVFEDYVRAYVELYYPDEGALARDEAAQRWFSELDRALVRGLGGYVPRLTRANLIKLCAVFIYSVSVEHEDNTMWDYAAFLPATVREDGQPESRGQVQSVVDFQVIISSATNRLMNDASHVALDATGAAVMRDFQARLAALQRELEAQPDRYWRIYPKNLEASISA